MPTLIGVATGAQLNAGKEMDPWLDAIADSGLQAIRTSAQWERIERTIGGGYDWGSTDPIVDGCIKRGLGIVLEAGSRDNNLYAPGMPEAYVKFWAQLADRYEGKLLATAAVNEPNHVKIAPKPDAKSYTQLIQVPGFVAVKKVAPTLTVLTGGLGGDKNDANDGDASDFLNACYAAGIKGHFDALAFHTYTHPLGWLESMAQHRGGAWLHHLAREYMRNNGEQHKLTWTTEDGWPTGGARQHDTYAQQAQHMVEWITESRKHHWCGPLFPFTWRDKGLDPNNYGDFMGLCDQSGKPKPALHAVAALVG